jgi:hypothetical protein
VPQARHHAREQGRRGVGAGQRGERRERGRDDEEVVGGEVAAEGVDEEDDEVGAWVEEQGAGEVGSLRREEGGKRKEERRRRGEGGRRERRRGRRRGRMEREKRSDEVETGKEKNNRWRCSSFFSSLPSLSPGSCRCRPAAP